jgi:hypothetical protein
VAESTLVREKNVLKQGARRLLGNIQRVLLGHREVVQHQDMHLMQQMLAMMTMMISCHQTHHDISPM